MNNIFLAVVTPIYDMKTVNKNELKIFNFIKVSIYMYKKYSVRFDTNLVTDMKDKTKKKINKYNLNLNLPLDIPKVF